MKTFFSFLHNMLFVMCTPTALSLFFLAPFLLPMKNTPSPLPLQAAPYHGGEEEAAPSFPKTPEDLDQNGIPDQFEKGLARKFAPCLVLETKKIWPVDHRYLWAKGGTLQRRVYEREGKTWKFLKEETIFSALEVEKKDWSRLDEGTPSNRQNKYYINGPGEDLSRTSLGMTWDQEFEQIQGNLSNPAQCSYPPTQYAHFYWVSYKKGILGIQYWFYYPYNKFINSHEGDWEHINVYIQLHGNEKDRFDPSKALQQMVRCRFYFHKYYIESDKIIRAGGRKASSLGDHPVVFVGGRGSFLIPELRDFQGWWDFTSPYFYASRGLCSGGSYPWPGKYWGLGGVGKIRASEELKDFGRFLHGEEFQIIVLPEPHQINYKKHPELSWMNLEFFSGQWTDSINSLVLRAAESHMAPLQPGRKNTWNERKPYRHWKSYAQSRFTPFQPPSSWKMIFQPSVEEIQKEGEK